MANTTAPFRARAEQAKQYRAVADAARSRVAASKRYKGRAQDLRDIEAYDRAADIHEAKQAEEDVEAARIEQLAFRDRVATRAFFMALNGQGRDDVDRWLHAEQLQRAAEAKPVPFRRVAGRDYYDGNAYRH